MEQMTNQPAETGLPASAVPDVHPEHEVGNGLTKKEAMRIRMQHMDRAEIAAMRRRHLYEKCWPVFRFLILFGLGFVILTPLLFMVSYGFRDSTS